MQNPHHTWLFLAALLLASCGKIEDELASPDAASWCAEPLGGQAARVSVWRSRQEDGSVTVSVHKLDAHENTIAWFQDLKDDGTIDDTSVTEWTYNEDGRWLEQRSDAGADGMLDRVMSRAVDENGDETFAATDEDGDGDWDRTVTSTYDEEGRTLSTAWDNDGDGATDSITTYAYEEGGGYTQISDNDLDGTPDIVHTTTVDDGVWLAQTDADADGSIDWANREIYDADGRLIDAATDYEGDGVFNVIVTYTYTPSGELETELNDSDGDGDVDLITTYARDSEGRLLSIESRTAGGVLAYSAHYSYDGGIVTEVRTNYAGDEISWTCTKTSEGEKPLSEGCDEDGDGSRDYLATYVDCR